MEFKHQSVLLSECMESLNIRPDCIYVDGTLGGGGHSLGILERTKTGRLVGIDRDAEAISAAKKRLAGFEDRVTFVNRNFSDIKIDVRSDLTNVMCSSMDCSKMISVICTIFSSHSGRSIPV